MQYTMKKILKVTLKKDSSPMCDKGGGGIELDGKLDVVTFTKDLGS